MVAKTKSPPTSARKRGRPKGSKNKVSRSTKSLDPESPEAIVRAQVEDRGVDVARLDQKTTAKRLKSIYELQKAVQNATVLHEIAKREKRTAKDNLQAAQESLEKEIREQREGPGPLFQGSQGIKDVVDGSDDDDESPAEAAAAREEKQDEVA